MIESLFHQYLTITDDACAAATLVLANVTMNATKGDRPETLTLEQAAVKIGYSPSGLRKLAKRGGVKYMQSGPRAPLLFRPEWLDALGTTEPVIVPLPRPKPKHGFDARLLG